MNSFGSGLGLGFQLTHFNHQYFLAVAQAFSGRTHLRSLLTALGFQFLKAKKMNSEISSGQSITLHSGNDKENSKGESEEHDHGKIGLL